MTSNPATPTIYVVYLPYLPIRDRVDLGVWELIPRGSLIDQDTVDAEVATLAAGFADLYALPRQAVPQEIGAFARLRPGRIGDDPQDINLIVNLRRALSVVVLDSTRSPLDEPDPNAGHYTLTSENATVAANGISREGGYTSTISGSRVRRGSLGVSVVSNPDPDIADVIPRFQIAPPADLCLPSMSVHLDFGYADAVWKSLHTGRPAARRLARAIDWLALAGFNTDSFTPELRVAALRVGFEVLLGTSDSLSLAGRLSNLIERRASRTLQSWRWDPGSLERSERLTEVAWWFVRFTLLRNDLMHGRVPARSAWRYDGRSNVDLAEWYLRDAIKAVVGKDHPNVAEQRRWREMVRAAQEELAATCAPLCDPAEAAE